MIDYVLTRRGGPKTSETIVTITKSLRRSLPRTIARLDLRLLCRFLLLRRLHFSERHVFITIGLKMVSDLVLSERNHACLNGSCQVMQPFLISKTFFRTRADIWCNVICRVELYLKMTSSVGIHSYIHTFIRTYIQMLTCARGKFC
jgi:hypothetical protein